MLGLVPDDLEVTPQGRAQRVPQEIRQEIDRLKALYASFHYRELARIIWYKVGYRITDKTAKVSMREPDSLWLMGYWFGPLTTTSWRAFGADTRHP
jgi:hypothetical protein